MTEKHICNTHPATTSATRSVPTSQGDELTIATQTQVHFTYTHTHTDESSTCLSDVVRGSGIASHRPLLKHLLRKIGPTYPFLVVRRGGVPIKSEWFVHESKIESRESRDRQGGSWLSRRPCQKTAGTFAHPHFQGLRWLWLGSGTQSPLLEICRKWIC